MKASWGKVCPGYSGAAPALACGTAGTALMNSSDIALLLNPSSPGPATGAPLH